MYKKYWIFIIILISTIKSFASVSVVDEELSRNEKSAMSAYVNEIKITITNLAKTKNSMAQLLDLKRIIKIQDDLANTCTHVCSPQDMKKIKDYLANLNKSITSEFKNYSNVLEDIDDLEHLEEYINNFTGDTKAISLALQKAAQQEEHQINASLLQIQALLTLKNEEHQTELKIEKQTTDDIYTGMANTGL